MSYPSSERERVCGVDGRMREKHGRTGGKGGEGRKTRQPQQRQWGGGTCSGRETQAGEPRDHTASPSLPALKLGLPVNSKT